MLLIQCSRLQPPCLPTSASWDNFLPYIAKMFVESHIEDVGDIIDDIHLLFVEVNTSSISIVIGPAQQCTPSIPAPTLVDDFLIHISSLFMESHLVDLEDNIDYIHLLFDEVGTSSVVMRAHSNPPIHCLHD